MNIVLLVSNKKVKFLCYQNGTTMSASTEDIKLSLVSAGEFSKCNEEGYVDTVRCS